MVVSTKVSGEVILRPISNYVTGACLAEGNLLLRLSPHLLTTHLLMVVHRARAVWSLRLLLIVHLSWHIAELPVRIRVCIFSLLLASQMVR